MPYLGTERADSLREHRLRPVPLSRPVRDFGELLTLVSQAASTKAKMPTVGISSDDFQELDSQLLALNPEYVKRRLVNLTNKLPPDIDPFERFTGGQLWQLRSFRGLTRAQLALATRIFLRDLALVHKTPEKYHEQKAPENEILNERLLIETLFYIELSGEGSVAYQLENPIELARKGVTINLRAKNDTEEIIVGCKLPTVLLDVLKSLKYSDSEKVFKEWVLVQLSKTEADTAQMLRFLRIFINFLSFLDSKTHMELWKPPAGIPDREEEFLVKAFNSIASCIGFARYHLSRVRANPNVVDELDELSELVKLRFGEVFSGNHQTSLYTASVKALKPSNEDFAKFANLHLKRVDPSDDKAKVASGLVTLAESIGIDDISPLIKMLFKQQDLHNLLVAEAEKTGLIKDPHATFKLWRKLLKEPWIDAALVKWGDLIKPSTKHFIVEVLTGTFGPLTEGHASLAMIKSEEFESLPKFDNEGGEIQRILLIVPMMDPSSNPEYRKIPSRIGSLYERVASIIGGLSAAGVDRKLVFVTTLLQPDPRIAQSLEDRVDDTINVLQNRITLELRRVRGLANVSISFNYTFGPDSIKWKKPEEMSLLPKEDQSKRVRKIGGSTVVRRNYLYTVLANLNQLKEQTGLSFVTLTPGTPYSSSTEAIKDLERYGESRFVAPGMQFFFVKHWNPDALRDKYNLPKATSYPTVDQAYSDLILEIENYLGSNQAALSRESL